MTHRIAFAGFRHPHIFALWARARQHPQCEIVAASEDDEVTRIKLQEAGEITVTHNSFEELLAQGDCSIVALGDVYAKRGAQAIAALKAGKHVISDKPLCTTLAELDEITRLSRRTGLSVGCQFDLVESGSICQLQQIIRDGLIGQVCTLNISAQHPLRYGTRAAWYFEPGQHGGTINDIGCHAFDLVPWLTGSSWKKLVTARTWNAKAAATPHFKDCAQFLALLESGASCFADLSYLAPNTAGFDLPHYWRITVHGTQGMAEASYALPEVLLVTDDDATPQKLPALTDPSPGYLQNFLDEIEGFPNSAALTTSRVLTSMRHALTAQSFADENTL